MTGIDIIIIIIIDAAACGTERVPRRVERSRTSREMLK
jgi:hypothetical protein